MLPTPSNSTSSQLDNAAGKKSIEMTCQEPQAGSSMAVDPYKRKLTFRHDATMPSFFGRSDTFKKTDRIDDSLPDNISPFSSDYEEDSDDIPVHDLKASLRVEDKYFHTKEEYQVAIKKVVNETKRKVHLQKDHPRGHTFNVYVCRSCDYHTSKSTAMARHLLNAHKIASIECD